MTQHDLLLVLVGQPNTGKSTLFSLLTGLHQKVGNYPGVTVEKKSGHYHEGDRRIEVVDLPGAYSLNSYSQEERITRDFLLLERPEVMVIVVDASNLRRHIPFVLQLLELQLPSVLCLNMTDVAERWGVSIDAEQLSQRLGVPVVPMVGRQGKGLAELRTAILRVSETTENSEHKPTPWQLTYSPELEQQIDRLSSMLATRTHLMEDFSARWLAVRLVEGDRESRRIVRHHTHDDSWREILDAADTAVGTIRANLDLPNEITATIAQQIMRTRHAAAESLADAVVTRNNSYSRKSDLLDRVACHPIGGLALVIAVLLVTFQIVFQVANGIAWVPLMEHGKLAWETPVGWCQFAFGSWLTGTLDALLGIEAGLFRSFLHNGIIAGVGGVAAFVPVIFSMFFFLSLLEQSGYMSRAVVVLDAWLRRSGLHGQSVLPLMLAGGMVGGCAVPAMLATRSMKAPRERLLTMLVIPFMNCGAKMTVYALLIAAFFASSQGLMMMRLIVASWGIALACAWVLGKTLVRGASSPLIIELPTYRLPSLTTALKMATRQSCEFLQKAATVILVANLALWCLLTFPANNEVNNGESSYAARIGRFFEPVTQCAGFDWRDNVALIGGVVAKEVIVSSLLTLHSHDSDSDREQLIVSLPHATGWSPLKAVAMMLFVMIYAPCTATLVTLWRETKSLRWVVISFTLTTLLAFAVATLVYQIGRFVL